MEILTVNEQVLQFTTFKYHFYKERKTNRLWSQVNFHTEKQAISWPKIFREEEKGISGNTVGGKLLAGILSYDALQENIYFCN